MKWFKNNKKGFLGIAVLFQLFLLCVIVSLAAVSFNFGVSAAEGEWGGSGTLEDPYTISDAAGFYNLASNINSGTSYSGKYFKLTQDISLSAYSSWTPMGSYPSSWGGAQKCFSGTLDGGCHTISDLTISSSNNAASFVGLFGYIYNGTVKNLYLENVSITTSPVQAGNNLAVGALVGQIANGTKIYNCGVKSGTINQPSSLVTTDLCAVGGLVGDSLNPSNSSLGGYISNCYAYVDITSAAGGDSSVTQNYVGGILGRIRNQGQATNDYPLNCVYKGNLRGNGYLAPIAAGLYKSTNTHAAISGQGLADSTMSYYDSSSTFFMTDGISPPNPSWNFRVDENSNYDPLGEPVSFSQNISSLVNYLNINRASITQNYYTLGVSDFLSWKSENGKVVHVPEREQIVSVEISKSNNNVLTADVSGIYAGDSVSCQWQQNGVDIPGATNSDYVCPYTSIDNFTSERVYSVNISVNFSDGGSGTAVSLPVTVLPVVSLSLSKSGSVIIAVPDFSPEFFVAVPQVSYAWTNASPVAGEPNTAVVTGAQGCDVTVNMVFSYGENEFSLQKSISTAKIIYVDQIIGNDNYDGSCAAVENAANNIGPVKSISKAYSLCDENVLMEGNVIVICGADYYNAGTPRTYRGIYNCVFSELLMQDRSAPPSDNPDDWSDGTGINWSKGKSVTITSKHGGVTYGKGIKFNKSSAGDQHVVLTGDTKFENIDFSWSSADVNNQWYANGCNFTMGEGITFSGIRNAVPKNANGIPGECTNYKDIHIIGAALSGDTILGGKENTITLLSGSFARVIGGGRNGNTFRNGTTYLDSNGVSHTYNYDSIPLEEGMYNSRIVVGGNAKVALVCGGQSDGIYFGNSDILIKENAQVHSLGGGNIGYNWLLDSERYNALPNYDTSKYTSSAAALKYSPYFNDFKGSSNITIEGGTLSQVCGASLGRFIWQCRFLGDVNITMTGGTINSVLVGGGAGAQTGALQREGGNFDVDYLSRVKINITGGTVNADVYGGSYGYYEYLSESVLREDDVAVFGSTEVSIGGSAVINGNVYGGSSGTNAYTSLDCLARVYGSNKVNISGNASILGAGGQNALVAGGGRGISGKPLTAQTLNYTNLAGEKVIGKCEVNIFSGLINGSVGAGSQFAEIGDAHDEMQLCVNIAGGCILGNVYGGCDQALANAHTAVNIGAINAGTEQSPQWIRNNLSIGYTRLGELSSGGNVFGGGNKAAGGTAFDSATPYVTNGSEINLTATGYNGDGQPTLKISDSFLASGNKCVVYGERIINIKDYGTSENIIKNKSIQRATAVNIENSHLELTGKIDTANLYADEEYSLNRIDSLRLVNRNSLYIKRNCNSLQEILSVKGAAPSRQQVTSGDLGSAPGLGDCDNRLYVYGGNNVTVNRNENLAIVDYGDIGGMAWLGIYDYDNASNIVPVQMVNENTRGIYVLGRYNSAFASSFYDYTNGFLSAAAQSDLNIGDAVIPQTDSETYRLWRLGNRVKNISVNLTASENETADKQVSEDLFLADGSRYIFELSRASFAVGADAQSGENFNFVSESALASDSLENEYALSVKPYSSAWADNTLSFELTGNTAASPQHSMSDSAPVYSFNTQNSMSAVKLCLACGKSFQHDGNSVAAVHFPIRVETELEAGTWVESGIINVTINIKREGENESYVSAAESGKHYEGVHTPYIPVYSQKPTIKITNKSAATIQYNRKYIDSAADLSRVASSINSRKLEFYAPSSQNSESRLNLPVGTNITMVDKSGSQPLYYYYKITSSGINSISLADFTQMGTQSTRYADNVQTSANGSDVYVNENFVFVFDFENVSSALNFAVEHFEARFNSYNSANELVFTPTPGRYSGFGVVAGTTLYDAAVATDKDSYQKFDRPQINTSVNVSTPDDSTDTTYDGFEMGVKFTLWKKNETTGLYEQEPFLKGMAFYYNGELCQPNLENSDCLITLASHVSSMNANLSLDLTSASEVLDVGDYEIRGQVLCAYDLNNGAGQETLVSDKSFLISVRDDKYAIRISIPDSQRLIYTNGKTLSGESSLTFTGTSLKQPLDAENAQLFLKLYKKNSSAGYDSVALNELFSGYSNSEYEREIPYGDQLAVNVPTTYSNPVVLKKSGISPGIYRIAFDVRVEGAENSRIWTEELINVAVTEP